MSADELDASAQRLDEAIRVDSDVEGRPDGITESEHAEIVGAVDALLTDRARPPSTTAPTEGRRSGSGLVALTNVAIVLALAGAVAAYVAFVPRAAPDVNVFSGEVTTAEGAILEQVQQEAERRLSEREEEIARIERELNALRRARTDEGDAAPSERELELASDLEALNATATERLGAIETNRERLSFLSDQLASVYERVQTAIRAQDYDRARRLVLDASALIEAPAVQAEPLLREASRSIDAANSVLAQILPLAAEDSGRLALLATQIEEIELIVAQADARARAGELERAETLYESALRMFESTDRAASQLLALEQERSRQALREQAESFQARISELGSRLQQSEATVTRLRSQVAQLEATRDRLQAREAELEQQRQELTTTLDALEDRRLELTEQTDEQAEELRQSEALATRLQRRVEALEGNVAELESTVASLERERDLTAGEAADEIASLTQALESAREEARVATRRLDEAADDLEADIAAARGDDAGPEVIDLLNTRVLLRAVVDSPSVRDEYPTLYDEMETYFAALSRARTEEGEAAAYRRASEIVAELASRIDVQLDVDSAPDTASGYLERVIELVRGAIAETVE